MRCRYSIGVRCLSHKADRSFFERKRYWSERKDRILGSYLTAYLPKIATQKVPIVVVDGFAGPGEFGDGKPGSPLIICRTVAAYRQFPNAQSVHVLCIEPEEDLASALDQRLKAFDFAKTEHSSFSTQVDRIVTFASNCSVFLYIDPFTVEGIVWRELDRVFAQLSKSRMSVEILMNFNGGSFVRRGLAALKRFVPPIDTNIEDPEEIDAPILESPTADRLTSVLGTDQWVELLSTDTPFPELVIQVCNIMKLNLRTRFKEVGDHAILAEAHHKVPKYSLIFGSRHPDALILFNDEFVKSTATLADRALPSDATLFEMRPEALVPDTNVLPTLIRRHCSHRIRRGVLIANVIRDHFGRFSKGQVRGAIETMLKSGEIYSATGKTRISDKVEVWLSKPP